MTEGRLAPEEVRTRTFTRVVRGYRRREVRRLLERAADDLARLRNGPISEGPDDEPPLTPEEVEEARFQPALGGYEMDEVDTFLDRVVAELERVSREPFRPASALPAPPRHAFPAATPGPQPVVPGPQPVVPGPPPVTPGPPPVAPDLTSATPAPPTVAPGPPAAPPRPPPQPPPAPPRPPVAAPGLPRAAPGPPPTTPGPPPAPEPSPAASDEGFFPPPSVPPSAAPAPTPPPPTPRPPLATPARPLTPSEVETRTFQRGAPGYLPTHVDLFLAKAARALAGRDGETLTRWDVLRQRFPLGPRGYATNEVDAFLVRLAAQFPDPDPAAQQEILRKLQER